jgi:FkbM family methyltransferase
MAMALLHKAVRFAASRRSEYRSALDVMRLLLLKAAARRYRDVALSIPVLLKLHRRGLRDPIHLRLGNSDFTVLEEVFAIGVYKRVKDWELPDKPKIIDLGANIGMSTLYFDSLYPQCRIVAVEPDETNCRLIHKNCRRLIREGRLHVHRSFISEKDGVAGLETRSGQRARQAWGFTKVDIIDDCHPAVPCISMPTLMDIGGIKRIDLLKCDIEGSERKLFRQCGQWIQTVNHLIVETHRSWTDRSDVYGASQLMDDLKANGGEFDVSFETQEELTGLVFLKRKRQPIK